MSINEYNLQVSPTKYVYIMAIRLTTDVDQIREMLTDMGDYKWELVSVIEDEKDVD